MTTPQIFEIEGKKFAAIPLDNYQSLLEDAEMLSDIASYREAKAEEGEYFPLELIDKILNGDNPIKVYREFRGLTQQNLADLSGISRNYVTELELGKKTGSITSLKAISKTLQVDLDDIVQ